MLERIALQVTATTTLLTLGTAWAMGGMVVFRRIVDVRGVAIPFWCLWFSCSVLCCGLYAVGAWLVLNRKKRARSCKGCEVCSAYGVCEGAAFDEGEDERHEARRRVRKRRGQPSPSAWHEGHAAGLSAAVVALERAGGLDRAVRVVEELAMRDARELLGDEDNQGRKEERT